MKKRMLSMVMAVAVMISSNCLEVKADIITEPTATVTAVNPITNETLETTNPIIKLDLTYNQTEARKALEYLNAFRTNQEEAWAWNSDDTEKVYYPGLTPMTYDYGLERIAMQRASETALLFGHTRPTGERFLQLFQF